MKLSEWIKKNKLSYSTISQKRSVLLSGHRTSISLELAFWLKLKEICEQQGKSINQQITEIDNTRLNKPNKNLSSAVRIFVLEQTSQN